jgi:hypothetical protein
VNDYEGKFKKILSSGEMKVSDVTKMGQGERTAI